MSNTKWSEQFVFNKEKDKSLQWLSIQSTPDTEVFIYYDSCFTEEKKKVPNAYPCL